MPRPTLSTLKSAAREWGATVDTTTAESMFVNVDAPTGCVWSSSLTHALCVSWDQPGWVLDRQFKVEAIADALERMANGLLTCDVKDCDICNDA